MSNQPNPRIIPPLQLEQRGTQRGSQIDRMLQRIERGGYVNQSFDMNYDISLAEELDTKAQSGTGARVIDVVVGVSVAALVVGLLWLGLVLTHNHV